MSETTELIAQQIMNGNINKRTWGDILYNVKVYGAKGDWNGTTGTDDTASVQATIDAAIAAGGKAVFFPHGTYKVTALTNVSSVILFGDNAVFSGINNTITQIGAPVTSGIVYNVKDYGAKGDGVTDDTTAIQATINAVNTAGGGIVFIPPGTYIVSDAGMDIKSNVYLQGSGKYITKLKIKAAGVLTPSRGFINGFNLSNFKISDMTIDNDNSTTTGTTGALVLSTCHHFEISDVYFYRFQVVGFNSNAVHDFLIRNCTFEFQTAKSTFNESILIGTTAGDSYNGRIEDNELINSGMDISGHGHALIHNDVANWKFGAGLTFESDPNTYGMIIMGNKVHGGTGTDVNAYTCGSLEIWAKDSIIIGNELYNNAGPGIDLGGQRCIVMGNTIFNNNQGAVGTSGIVIRYTDATYNGSYSVISGNTIFNTAPGGSQIYGIADQAVNTQSVQIGYNQIFNNFTAPFLYRGSQYSIANSELQFKGVIDVPSLATGTAYQINIVAAGADVNDFIMGIGASINTQGIKIIAWVDATNSISLRFENNTGATVDLASATYSVNIKKNTVV